MTLTRPAFITGVSLTGLSLTGPALTRLPFTVPPPVDPLGSVSQNPDDVRAAACRLVESRSVCSPPSVPSSVTPARSSDSLGSGLFGPLLWGLLVMVVVAIGYVAYRYLRDRTPLRADSGDDADDLDPDGDAMAGAVVVDRSREPRAWRLEADEHRAAGRYRDALRCRYRALVGDLARRGLLDEIPGRTTGEERRQLRNTAPAAVAPFREAADLFDDAWYGARRVGAGDDDRFQNLDRQVLADVGPG